MLKSSGTPSGNGVGQHSCHLKARYLLAGEGSNTCPNGTVGVSRSECEAASLQMLVSRLHVDGANVTSSWFICRLVSAIWVECYFCPFALVVLIAAK